MPLITIPKSAHKVLKSLSNLDDSQFSRLITALSEATAGLSMSHFAEEVASRFEHDASSIKAIVVELFQIDGVRETFTLTPAELAQSVADAASDISALSEEDRQVLRNRLQQIFEGRTSLSLTAKAGGVACDYERVFYNARILTDVRPVFDHQGEVVEAAAIIHNLVIHFGENSEHKDFYVTLDTQDIDVLRKALDRAATKANALRNLLQNTKVSYLAPGQ